jgi:hypothetical protein
MGPKVLGARMLEAVAEKGSIFLLLGITAIT